jgi:hypothetical protein
MMMLKDVAESGLAGDIAKFLVPVSIALSP